MPERTTLYAVGLGLTAAVVGLVCLQPAIPSAVFQDLSLFRVLLETGRLPEADPFAFHQGRNPFAANEWGAGGVAYLFLVASRWGEAGWLLLKLICLLTVGVGCYRQAMRHRVQFPVFAIHSCLALCLAFGFSLGQCGAGALTSMVLLTGQLMLIDWLAQNKNRLVIKPALAAVLLFALWSNLQNSVLVGLLICLIAWFDGVCRSWQSQRSIALAVSDSLPNGLIGCLASFACLLNPLGIELFLSVNGLLANGTSDFYRMDPLWLSAPVMLQWTFVFSVLLAGYACWKSEQWPVLESFGLALLILLSIRTTQLAGLYLVGWLFWVPRLVSMTSLGRMVNRLFCRHEPVLWRLAVVASVLFLIIAMQTRLETLPWQLAGNTEGAGAGEGGGVSQRSSRYPQAVVAFLKEEGFVGNLLVPCHLGSYLNWELYPLVRTSVDSRGASFFPGELIQDNGNFYRGDSSWPTALENPLHEGILIPINEPIYAPLKSRIERNPQLGWKQIYQDRGFAIFTRSDHQLAQHSRND